MKERSIFAEQLSEHPTSDFILFAAIGKNIVHFAMTMQIDAIINLVLLLELSQLIFYVVDLRMQLLDRVSPRPVKVKASEIASAVAVNYAINIDHGVDSELIVSEQPRYLLIGFFHQRLKYMFHEQRRVCLSGMLPRCYYDHFLSMYIILLCIFAHFSVGGFLYFLVDV